MSLGRTLALCIASAALIAVAVVRVPSLGESAAKGSGGKVEHEVRAQLQKERARAHRALSIRTVQVRRLRARLRQAVRMALAQPNVQQALALEREWPKWQEDFIIRRESNWIASARNLQSWPPGSVCHATGLWQILDGGPGRQSCSTWDTTPYAERNPLDPYWNAAAARWLWKRSGGSFCVHWRPLPWC